MDVLWIVLSGVAGLAIGSGCMVGLSKAGLNKNQQKAEQILKEAQNDAERHKHTIYVLKLKKRLKNVNKNQWN